MSSDEAYSKLSEFGVVWMHAAWPIIKYSSYIRRPDSKQEKDAYEWIRIIFHQVLRPLIDLVALIDAVFEYGQRTASLTAVTTLVWPSSDMITTLFNISIYYLMFCLARAIASCCFRCISCLFCNVVARTASKRKYTLIVQLQYPSRPCGQSPALYLISIQLPRMW